MSDSFKQELNVSPPVVLLGSLQAGTEWPVNKRGMTNRTYPEPDWIVWFQLAKVSTTEAACLSIGWCPIEWAAWQQSVSSTAQIREIARPYLDMLAKRTDIFGNHSDAIVAIGECDKKMIDLTSARKIACAEGWDVPVEFELHPTFAPEVPLVLPPAQIPTSLSSIQRKKHVETLLLPVSSIDPVLVPTALDVPLWIINSRNFATEYLIRHTKENLFPSQTDVCSHVEGRLRKESIYGPHKRPLSVAYIRRNAIGGEWWKSNKP